MLDTSVKSTALLTVQDVEVCFTLKRSSLFAKPPLLRAVDGVTLSVSKGQTMGIVGESGSGKTTLALAVARLLPVTRGQIHLNGVDLLSLRGETLRNERHHMQFIFQDPYSSLNPRLRAEKIVREPLDRLSIGPTSRRDDRIRELFDQVGLRRDQQRLFPHQFSGGQRQRIGIARAIASNPSLVICDEPVSALDVSVQSQVLNLLMDLQGELGLSYLFISHDLAVVKHVSDRIAVMYLGKIVELASADEIYAHPRHAYTKALISAIPVPDPAIEREHKPIEGDVPSPIDPPPGCAFGHRVSAPKYKDSIGSEIALKEITPGHLVSDCPCCVE